MTTVTQVLLGFAVLAAALHGAHAGLSLSASVTSTQTVDGQWADTITGNRFMCTESQGNTFICSTTLSVDGVIRNYFGQVSKSASPRVYVAGAQQGLIAYDASSFRFTLSADGKGLSSCYAVTSTDAVHPFSICNTWSKLTAVEGFAFSFAEGPPPGPAIGIPGMTCVTVDEPSEDVWFDNYFCSINDRGIKWSANGTLSGMKCTLVNEPQDSVATAWNNNYICVPTTSTINFVWSSAGAVAGKTCTRWYEPLEDPTEGWDNNYLCY